MLLKKFFLDYFSFQKEIKPLLPEIDRGNYKALYERAEKVFKAVKPQDWLLQEQGTMLEPIELAEITSVDDVGYLLLVILSTYLKPIPYVYHKNSIIRDVLTWGGWNMVDIELFFTGSPTSLLIKEDALLEKGEILCGEKQPYWFWVIPTQAHSSGWLSLEQIRRFNHQFADISRKFGSFSIPTLRGKFGNAVGEDPKDILSRTKLELANIQEVLTKAEQMNSGIFIVFS